MPNIKTLSMRVLSTYALVTMGYAYDTGDIVAAVAVPVFMLEGVVDTMNQVKKIGAEQRALDKKRLVPEILSIVLLVLPLAGELASAAFGGVAMVARLALVIGEVGNLALTIESIVDDPASAPFAIMALLLAPYGGASGRTSTQGFKEAADARRALSATGS